MVWSAPSSTLKQRWWSSSYNLRLQRGQTRIARKSEACLECWSRSEISLSFAAKFFLSLGAAIEAESHWTRILLLSEGLIFSRTTLRQKTPTFQRKDRTLRGWELIQKKRSSKFFWKQILQSDEKIYVDPKKFDNRLKKIKKNWLPVNRDFTQLRAFSEKS